ncbi:sugar ABC transporter permease [Luteipulveratus mongoliensis]|uniref:Sugar ABC transporter permease n=1 Tax=Luteipulveratus mongoliensis TaxID=571913 RepID=A0A0K1JP68_9MICO|nr:sugar ABC transporter permease [Luteipulveratus mongoliensis]
MAVRTPPRPARPPVRKGSRRRRRETLRNLAFLSPWLLGTGLFFFYPLVSSAYYSFTHYDGFGSPTFDGLSNWRFVFSDYPFFWPALRNTLWLVVVMVTLRVIFGLGVGMLVIRLKRGANLFRTLYYAPYLAPPVASTLAFVFLLNPGTGPVNTILGKVGLPEPAWFNDPAWSKPALTLLALWGIGDLMVIFMASLLDVPKEQYEAAQLDGAGPFQQFRFVTLPHLRPILTFAAVTGVIATMQYYTEPLVAGQIASGQIGGSGQQTEPGYPDKSTLTLPQLVYHLGFQRFDIGAACVIALVLFALSMVFAALLMRRGGGFLGNDA